MGPSHYFYFQYAILLIYFSDIFQIIKVPYWNIEFELECTA